MSRLACRADRDLGPASCHPAGMTISRSILISACLAPLCCVGKWSCASCGSTVFGMYLRTGHLQRELERRRVAVDPPQKPQDGPGSACFSRFPPLPVLCTLSAACRRKAGQEARGTAIWRLSGLLAGTLVEITNLYLDGVPHLQHLPSGFAPCLPVMVAKK